MLDLHFLAVPALAERIAHAEGQEKYEHARERELREKGELAPVLAARPKVFGIGFDTDVRRWTAPLWLAALDQEVVARSAALVRHPKGLVYREAQTYSPTLFGFVSAWLTFFTAYAFAGLVRHFHYDWVCGERTNNQARQ